MGFGSFISDVGDFVGGIIGGGGGPNIGSGPTNPSSNVPRVGPPKPPPPPPIDPKVKNVGTTVRRNIPAEDLIPVQDLSAEREKRLKDLRDIENQLRGELVRRTEDVGTAIDEELNQLTQEVGFNTAQAQRTVAGQQAGRGLLRSSFTGERAGEVAQRGLQAQSQLEAQARQRRFATQEAARKAIGDIAVQREILADRIRQADEDALRSINEQFNIQTLRNNFEREITQLEIDQANKAAIIGNVGSLLGDVTNILTRG